MIALINLMNPKKLAYIILFTIVNVNGFAQDPVIHGKPIAEIFTDFHLHPYDTIQTSGFALNRAYLGYTFIPGNDFSSTIVVNAGMPEELAPGSVPKRYAYFREASVAYTKGKMILNFGMVNTRIFNFQQDFWGKRYLGPEFQAAYGYGSVADLGVVMDYRLNKIFKVDLSLLNGKGYTNIQFDNSLKAAVGITITTPRNISVRLYADMMKPAGILQNTLVAFAGFRNHLFSFGAETSFKSNLDMVNGHNVWGTSATGSLFLNHKSEIFLRYDYSASTLDPEAKTQWYSILDGTYLIAGYQREINTNVKVAINYRRTNPYSPDLKNTNSLYINASFKFR